LLEFIVLHLEFDLMNLQLMKQAHGFCRITRLRTRSLAKAFFGDPSQLTRIDAGQGVLSHWMAPGIS